MKSLLTIWQQYRRIVDGWSGLTRARQRYAFKTYSRYLVNIAVAEGVHIPEGSDYMPGVAACIAFPDSYWKKCSWEINNSQAFKDARAKMYDRSIYAK